MARHPTPPHCEWPRSVCYTPPLPQPDRNAATLCEEHFKAWALVMDQLMEPYRVPSPKS